MAHTGSQRITFVAMLASTQEVHMSTNKRLSKQISELEKQADQLRKTAEKKGKEVSAKTSKKIEELTKQADQLRKKAEKKGKKVASKASDQLDEIPEESRKKGLIALVLAAGAAVAAIVVKKRS